MRFNPLVLIAALIVFSLLDLVLQWAKRRANQGQPQMPGEPKDDRAFEDEAAEDFELEREEPEATPFPAPPPPPPPAPAHVSDRMPAFRSQVPARMPALRSQESVPRLRRERWTMGPGDARRGMVLMTVLGPCRAEEMDNR